MQQPVHSPACHRRAAKAAGDSAWLYSFPTPNGHKVSIALEELALVYEVVPINIIRGDQFMPEFLTFSPNNRIPAIVDHAPDDGGAPFTVFESGAILIYLGEYPSVLRWFDSFQERPAVQRGLAAGESVWGQEPLSDAARRERFGCLSV